MPANSFLGNRAIVRVVNALGSFVYDRAASYAAVLSVPSGGTALVLPDSPGDGDSYQWANPDNSAGAGTPVILALSSRAIAVGVTIQGASSQTFATAGTSGRVVFFARANTWQVFAASSSSAAAPSSSIIWRPGGVAGGNIVTTWPEVQNAIALANGDLEVRADSSLAACTVSAGETLCRGGVQLAGFTNELNLGNPTGWANQITLPDGATLNRLRAINSGVGVICNSQTTAALTFTQGPGNTFDYFAMDAGSLVMASTASRNAIDVTGTLEISLIHEALFGLSGAPAPIVTLANGGVLALTALAFSRVDPGSVGGVAGSTFRWNYDDSSYVVLPFPSFGGTFDNTRVSFAAQAAPAFEVSADRPAGPNVQAGQMFFDATLEAPIWFSAGSVWIGPTKFGDALGQAPTATFPVSVTSAVFTAGADDTAGTITVTPVGGGAGPGRVVTIDFTAPLAEIPRVVFAPANAAAAAAVPWVQNVTADGFDLAITNVTTGVMVFNYMVVPRYP